MNYGVYKRNTARLNICRGSDLTTAMKRTAAYPCKDEVLSGEPVMAAADFAGAGGIVFKAIDSATPKNVYWAFSDCAGEAKQGRDFDVQSVGKLDAIYGGDKFEITTPFFDKTKEYAPGAKLYLKDVSGAKDSLDIGCRPAGNFIITSELSDTEADATVIGVVSEGVINLGGSEKDILGDDNGITVANSDGAEWVVGGPRTYTNDTKSTQVLKFFTELA